MSAYLTFFELEQSPFDTSSANHVVLGTKALRDAFAQIQSGLAEGAPRICVSGGAGMGKTSLARALPKLLRDDARVSLLLNPALPWATLRTAIVRQLDLEGGALSRRTLMAAAAKGKRPVVVIDAAERITRESLDHLDVLLGYRGDDDTQLVHCVMLANLEQAAADGECPLLWWLDSLHTLQLEFAPIPAHGVVSYIDKHLRRAGWKGGQLFTAEACHTVHRLTGGVPRKVSELCQQALETAAERSVDRIEPALVEEVAGETAREPAAPRTAESAPAAAPSGDHQAAHGMVPPADADTEADAVPLVDRSEMPSELLEEAPATDATPPAVGAGPAASRVAPTSGDAPSSGRSALDTYFGPADHGRHEAAADVRPAPVEPVDEDREVDPGETTTLDAPAPRARRLPVLATAAVLLLAIAGGTTWLVIRRDAPEAAESRAPGPALARRTPPPERTSPAAPEAKPIVDTALAPPSGETIAADPAAAAVADAATQDGSAEAQQVVEALPDPMDGLDEAIRAAVTGGAPAQPPSRVTTAQAPRAGATAHLRILSRMPTPAPGAAGALAPGAPSPVPVPVVPVRLPAAPPAAPAAEPHVTANE